MAFYADVKFERGDIPGLLARVAAGLYDGVLDASEMVYQEAVSRCPVDTGALVSSIGVEIFRGIQAMKQGGPLAGSMFSVLAQIAPHTHYAAYVEYGTGQRGASSAGAGPGPYSPTWPGMAAQPYMRPALDNNRAEVEDVIREAVAAVLP